MNALRKAIAMLFLILIILLLPLALLLKNANDVLFSPQKLSGLADELTFSVHKNTIKDDVMPAFANVTLERELLGIDWIAAWETLDDPGLVAVAEILAPPEAIQPISAATLASFYAWLDAPNTAPEVNFDFTDIKAAAPEKTTALSLFILNEMRTSLPECTPEQNDYIFSTPPTAEAFIGLVSPEGTNIPLTIYQILLVNPSETTPYLLDDMTISVLGDGRLKSNMSVPSCAKFIGEVIAPGEEILCKVDGPTGMIDEINATLHIQTSPVLPDDFATCLPPAEYDEDISPLLETETNAIMLDNFAEKYPEKHSLISSGGDYGNLAVQVAQARQIASLAWLILGVVLLLAALLGGGVSLNGLLNWLGIPLLLSGGITIALYTRIGSLQSLLMDTVASQASGEISPTMLASTQEIYTKLTALIAKPLLLQAGIMLVAGVLFIVIARVLKPKASVDSE